MDGVATGLVTCSTRDGQEAEIMKHKACMEAAGLWTGLSYLWQHKINTGFQTKLSGHDLVSISSPQTRSSFRSGQFLIRGVRRGSGEKWL